MFYHQKNGRKQMLNSPASGNYLFHEGTVTSVYLGQINRERIVTSPPFCLCLCRHFILSRCRSKGRTPKPHSHFTAHSQKMQAGPKPLPSGGFPAHSHPHHKLLQPPRKFSISSLQDEDGFLLGFGHARQYRSLHVDFF